MQQNTSSPLVKSVEDLATNTLVVWPVRHSGIQYSGLLVPAQYGVGILASAILPWNGRADTLAGREGLHTGHFGRCGDHARRILGYGNFRQVQELDTAASQGGCYCVSRRRYSGDDFLRSAGYRSTRALELQRGNATF